MAGLPATVPRLVAVESLQIPGTADKLPKCMESESIDQPAQVQPVVVSDGRKSVSLAKRLEEFRKLYVRIGARKVDPRLLHICCEPHCYKIFNNAANLSTHRSNEHGGPFPCKLCSSVYKKRQSLRNHYKRAHKWTPPRQKQQKVAPMGNLTVQDFIIRYNSATLANHDQIAGLFGDLSDYQAVGSETVQPTSAIGPAAVSPAPDIPDVTTSGVEENQQHTTVACVSFDVSTARKRARYSSVCSTDGNESVNWQARYEDECRKTLKSEHEIARLTAEKDVLLEKEKEWIADKCTLEENMEKISNDNYDLCVQLEKLKGDTEEVVRLRRQLQEQENEQNDIVRMKESETTLTAELHNLRLRYEKEKQEWKCKLDARNAKMLKSEHEIARLTAEKDVLLEKEKEWIADKCTLEENMEKISNDNYDLCVQLEKLKGDTEEVVRLRRQLQEQENEQNDIVRMKESETTLTAELHNLRLRYEREKQEWKCKLDASNAKINLLQDDKLLLVKDKVSLSSLRKELDDVNAELAKEMQAKNLLVLQVKKLEAEKSNKHKPSKARDRSSTGPLSQEAADTGMMRFNLNHATEELKSLKEGIRYIFSNIHLPGKAPLEIEREFKVQIEQGRDVCEAMTDAKIQNFAGFLGYIIQQDSSSFVSIRSSFKRLLDGMQAADLECSRAMAEIEQSKTSSKDGIVKLGPTGMQMVRRLINMPPARVIPCNNISAPCYVDGANVCRAYVINDEMRTTAHIQPAQYHPLNFQILLNWARETLERNTFSFITVVIPAKDMFNSRGMFLYRQSNALIQLQQLDEDIETNFRIIYAMGKAYDDILVFVLAHEFGGVIVSNDKFRDLIADKPADRHKPLDGIFHEYELEIYHHAEEGTLTYSYDEERETIRLGADPNGKFGKPFPAMIAAKRRTKT